MYPIGFAAKHAYPVRPAEPLNEQALEAFEYLAIEHAKASPPDHLIPVHPHMLLRLVASIRDARTQRPAECQLPGTIPSHPPLL